MSTPESFARNNSGITPSSFSAIEWMNDIELLVPLYQRLFVWEEEQINQLLEDLERAYHTQTPYYIGTLTVYRHPNEPSTWELVDGQQRLTVLTLFGACSQNRAKGSLWKTFLVKPNGTDSRLRYFARQQDEEDLKMIIKEGSIAHKIANTNMKRFIEAFDRFMARPRDGQRCQMNESDFSKFVYEKTTALVAFLPDSYKLNDLNLYFEKMNAGGKQLEAHEIVKGRYFGKHSAKWNAIADGGEPFSSKNEKSGPDVDLTLESLLLNGGDLTENKPEPSEAAIISDSSRLVMSFPVFLLHSIRVCIGPFVESIIGFWEPKHLLSTFRTGEAWWKENRNDKPFADAFVEVMEAYRKWMDKWIIHIEDERPVSPYQQESARTDQYGVEWAHEAPLWQFQSMLYVSGSERQSWVLDGYLESLKVPLMDQRKDEFLALLKQQDGKRHPPNFGDDDPTVLSYGQIDRYWFWKLDYILWEKVFNKEPSDYLDDVQATAVKSYTFRRNRSIEHLHPQTSENAWGDKALHSFGNLAMISASFNSQLGNDSVGTKFGRMADKLAKKDLESIKLLRMFNDADGKDVQWTKVASEKHCSEMMKILKDYYAVTCGA